MAMAEGLVPVLKLKACVVKEIAPPALTFLNIDTTPEPEFTSTTSGKPSPSTSPTTTEEDTEPATPLKLIAVPNVVAVAPDVVAF
jgi:hypothetical protein